MEKITVDTIINYLQECAETKRILDPEEWIRAAQNLNVLVQNEQDELFLLEQQVAEMRKSYLLDGKTVAYAKTMVEASNEYAQLKRQKAKIDRVLETIRLAKKSATLASETYKQQ